VAGLGLSLAALAYLYLGARRYHRLFTRQGRYRVRWWESDWFDKRFAWSFLAVEVVLFFTWRTAALVLLGVLVGVTGFLLAPSSIVELWVNLRRELPVEAAARAQLTATAGSSNRSL
jgi:hypothetical protein